MVRDAFSRASKRRKHLTLVHKTNVLTFAGGLWSRIVAEVGSSTGRRGGYQHIDAATIHMVTDPGRFDVIVTDNLFGDIITDLAVAVSGRIRLAASNIDATGTNPSMFEPVHGSAPDIAGKGHRRPTAAVMRWRCCCRTWARTRRGARRCGRRRSPGYPGGAALSTAGWRAHQGAAVAPQTASASVGSARRHPPRRAVHAPSPASRTVPGDCQQREERATANATG